jgi:hypothetical protein
MSKPRYDQPATWRRRCGWCKTPLTGYDAEVERVPVAANPEDSHLAAMGVPVGSIPTKWVAVKIIITHQPCGHEYWKDANR